MPYRHAARMPYSHTVSMPYSHAVSMLYDAGVAVHAYPEATVLCISLDMIRTEKVLVLKVPAPPVGTSS